jgi:hypothetical protein
LRAGLTCFISSHQIKNQIKSNINKQASLKLSRETALFDAGCYSLLMRLQRANREFAALRFALPSLPRFAWILATHPKTCQAEIENLV